MLALFVLIAPLVCVVYMCNCSKQLHRYNPMLAEKTGLIKYMLLYLVTCGLYGTYFGYKISNDVHEVGLSFRVKTILKGWLGLLLLSSNVLYSILNILLGSFDVAEGSFAEGVFNFIDNLFGIIGLLGPVVFLFILMKDMKKLKTVANQNVSMVARNNMQSAVSKASAGNVANMAARTGMVEGKKIASNMSAQARVEAQEEVARALQNPNDVASLTSLASEMNNGPVKEIPEDVQ